MIFAEDNHALDTCHPNQIIGRPILEFIAGKETRNLYALLIERTREKQIEIAFPFRCDSPRRRRFLEMHITSIDDNIEFNSRTLREEPREEIELLGINVSRSEDFISICSMCKKVDLSKEEWVEIEVAVVKMRLFEKTRMPQLSHGLCLGCYESVIAEIDKS